MSDIANLVLVESPYAGDITLNLTYLRACMRDCLLRGEAPFASHGLYTQSGVLDDNDPEERKLGMEAGWSWLPVVDLVVVYTDFGISVGMKAGVKRAISMGKTVVYRTLEERDRELEEAQKVAEAWVRSKIDDAYRPPATEVSQSTFDSCNRARMAAEDECDRLRTQVENGDVHIRSLVIALHKAHGTPCEQIRHEQEVERFRNELKDLHDAVTEYCETHNYWPPVLIPWKFKADRGNK